jgi:predicted aldo/keto reductase-like oxidoreductase
MEFPPPYDIFIQTRPEGMVYIYDPYNARMARYEDLKAEVQRGLKLLRRECLDFLNVAFMQSALDHDPEYLDKIRRNIGLLKKDGLIRFACADTFSGEETYLHQIEAGFFDAIYISFNFGDNGAKRRVFEEATRNELGVITREAFLKGEVYKMGDEAGISDRGLLSKVALKWNLSHPEVTTVLVGTNNPEHLLRNLETLESLQWTQEDREILDRIKKTNRFKEFDARKTNEFFGRA